MLTRLLICGVCAAFAAVSTVGAGTLPPTIQVSVLPDGSFMVEGHRYATPPAMEAEIYRLDKRRPRPNLEVQVDNHAHYDVVAKTMVLFQKTGAIKIGIVNTWDDKK